VSLWQDGAVVKFATTIHKGTEWIIRERKKPRDSSSSAAITKAPFEAFPAIGAPQPTQQGRKKKEYVHHRPLLIPQMVDDYNHFMNGVDIADQLRASLLLSNKHHELGCHVLLSSGYSYLQCLHII
jgi:hypothetical protein